MDERATRTKTALEIIVELAAPTHGYFLSRDARDEGVLPSALSRLRSLGTIESVGHGINRMAATPDSWDGRALAAVWSAGPASALGRWAALRTIEGRDTSPRIDVLVPRSSRSRKGTTAIRSHVRLTGDDLVEINGLRVTSPPFTVCDLAPLVSVEKLVSIADRLIADDQLTLDDLRVMVGRFWAIEGVEKLREMLKFLSPSSRWTRSDAERTWRRLVVAAGIPELVVNKRVVDADGRRRYLDFSWPDLRVAIEVDFYPDHSRTIGRNADGSRQNALVLAGWTVIRFDIFDLMLRPDHVIETLRRIYAAAST